MSISDAIVRITSSYRVSDRWAVLFFALHPPRRSIPPTSDDQLSAADCSPPRSVRIHRPLHQLPLSDFPQLQFWNWNAQTIPSFTEKLGWISTSDLMQPFLLDTHSVHVFVENHFSCCFFSLFTISKSIFSGRVETTSNELWQYIAFFLFFIFFIETRQRNLDVLPWAHPSDRETDYLLAVLKHRSISRRLGFRIEFRYSIYYQFLVLHLFDFPFLVSHLSSLSSLASSLNLVRLVIERVSSFFFGRVFRVYVYFFLNACILVECITARINIISRTILENREDARSSKRYNINLSIA